MTTTPAPDDIDLSPDALFVLAYRVRFVPAMMADGRAVIETWDPAYCRNAVDDVFKILRANCTIAEALIDNNAHGGPAEPRHRVGRVHLQDLVVEFHAHDDAIGNIWQRYDGENVPWPVSAQQQWKDAMNGRVRVCADVARRIMKAFNEYESKEYD